MYLKQWKAVICIIKSTLSAWVKWVHHSEGNSHCETCLALDGCFFREDNAPPCPHHPFCHCTLEEIDYADVLAYTETRSDYSKYDPYLFNTTGRYPHGKEKMLASWGYTVEDAKWLQNEIERQARAKYISGEYSSGKLTKDGQRISIRIEIPRKSGIGTVSFISGWMVEPNGRLKLTTPYGGK